MKEADVLLSWQSLHSSYILANVPIELPISATFSLIFDINPHRLGLRLEIDQDRDWKVAAGLQNITARRAFHNGLSYVELYTNEAALFRPIYALVADVIGRLADGENDALSALDASLGDFEALLAKTTEMSREKAIGLFGELMVLQEILRSGTCGVASWIGSNRESHDFRMTDRELEVKTTLANTRKHYIHGLNQLTPTPGHRLSIVSVKLGSPGAGAGHSLNDLVKSLSSLLAGDAEAFRAFKASLQRVGYDESFAECQRSYQLSGRLMSIEVGSEFPEMSHAWLLKSLGGVAAARISEVQLEIDLEGLGAHFDPAKDFQ